MIACVGLQIVTDGPRVFADGWRVEFDNDFRLGNPLPNAVEFFADGYRYVCDTIRIEHPDGRVVTLSGGGMDGCMAEVELWWEMAR
jgi:hypothetical protein